MKTVYELLSFDNAVFKAYLFYCAALVIKLVIMVPLTARLRAAKRIFITEEDTKLLRGSKVKYDDPDIERVRRAHLNDLENIPMFFAIALAYILTDPNAWLAINLMRAFTFARYAHTLVYAVVVIPQPARALAFGIGYFITIHMAVQTLLTFW
ncbi:hypothetical protein O3M35_009114 [Rhynocoris fuscipes]|uniref:Microsomal glutathione S-transferase 1 n=1 Tax=Rhynocoris fuscipes TaxID=488301 RepID=A0AAW1D740_9HEMI